MMLSDYISEINKKIDIEQKNELLSEFKVSSIEEVIYILQKGIKNGDIDSLSAGLIDILLLVNNNRNDVFELLFGFKYQPDLSNSGMFEMYDIYSTPDGDLWAYGPLYDIPELLKIEKDGII